MDGSGCSAGGRGERDGMVGCASAKLNDRMAVGASQVLALLAVPHLGCPPNGEPDEIHLR